MSIPKGIVSLILNLQERSRFYGEGELLDRGQTKKV